MAHIRNQNITAEPLTNRVIVNYIPATKTSQKMLFPLIYFFQKITINIIAQLHNT